jgi:2-oxoisovalerate dehydrogenase E2 component (dihydrolipoyl transacylase)
MKIFNLPDLGEGLAEAEIVRWHVNTGDHIDADAPMLAVETAKAIVEVPSPFSGVIKAIHGNPGDMVATGALLVEFEADAPPASDPVAGTTNAATRATSPSVGTRVEAARGATAPAAGTASASRPIDSGTVVGSMPTSDEDFVDTHGSNTGGDAGANGRTPAPDRVRAVPAARALAKRLSIDISQIRGTGRGELVTVDDVLHMTAAGASPTTRDVLQTTAAASPSAAPGILRTTAGATKSVINGAPHTPAGQAPNATSSLQPPATEGERLRGPRRAMAHSMAVSRDNVMGCTLFDDADLHDWQPEQDITSRILRAIAKGCAAEPGLNAWFDGDALTRRLLSQIDVAIAVDTPEGLIVPVVRNIGGRPVADLRRDVDRLKRDTHERTVRPEDLRDFTFMLSNFGMIAGRYATPVVVPPAVAILGCGRLSHDVIATQSGSSSARTSSQQYLSGSSSAKTSSQHYPSGNNGGGKLEAHLRMPLSLTFDHRCVTGGEAARFLAAVIRDLQKGN